MNQVIEIIVSTTGETRVTTQGFAGNQCRQASEFLEKALGKRTSEELTSEFHESVNEQQQNFTDS